MNERINLHALKKEKGYNSVSRFLLPSIMLNPSLTDFNALHYMGYLDAYLYDMTKGKRQYFPNSLLLCFNPSISFFNNGWEDFEKTMKDYPNFIEIIEYNDYIYGLWFKINEERFGKNLRYFYKRGFFSAFPKQYITFLNDTEKKICTRDKTYQYGLEKRCGLEKGDLEGVELGTLPEKEEYCVNFTKYLKNE